MIDQDARNFAHDLANEFRMKLHDYAVSREEFAEYNQMARADMADMSHSIEFDFDTFERFQIEVADAFMEFAGIA